MRLEPLVTLKIRDNINRAAEDLSDIDSHLRFMEDFSRPENVCQCVEHGQATLIRRVEKAIGKLNDARWLMQAVSNCTKSGHDITIEDCGEFLE